MVMFIKNSTDLLQRKRCPVPPLLPPHEGVVMDGRVVGITRV